MTLTTITPIWGRWDAFDVWARNLEMAHVDGVSHLVFCPESFASCPKERAHFRFVSEGKVGDSIGWYHNRGAELASSDWIMKLDVDAMVNSHYFRELLRVLEKARPREWFNGGMLFVQPGFSIRYLCSLLTSAHYQEIMGHRQATAGFGGEVGGSNFICRRRDYQDSGGCDSRFRGWGWEDYQQTFALESQYRANFPLPRQPTLEDVTRLCRDWITKPKARSLLLNSSWLCLLHRWHPQASRMDAVSNQQVLYSYITDYEKKHRNRSSLPGQDEAGRILGPGDSGAVRHRS